MSERNRMRQIAIKNARASNALSGFLPTEFGMSVHEKWIAGELNANAAVLLLIAHHKSLELAPGSTSDHKAPQNLLGITDRARMQVAESDITTLRMAELFAADD